MAADTPTSPEPIAPARGPYALAGLIAGPLALVVTLLTAPPAGLDVAGWRTAGVALAMALWWISEAVPLPATALLPLALFPVLGVAPVADAARPYANPVIFLFMGGFMLAQGVQRWGLHRRLALHIVRAIGTEPRRMVGGFMVASAVISMWVSNTATAVMMLPIGLSTIDLVLKNQPAGGPPVGRNFGTALMLGIAYAASIGGVATLIGSPPNALFAGYMSETFGYEVDFAGWLRVGLPVTVVMLPLAWRVLTHHVFPVRMTRLPGGAEMIERELAAMGPPSRGEWLAGSVFALVAFAWITRPWLARWLPGLSDAGIAIAGAVALFAIPVRPRRAEFVLDWPSAARIPWDVLLLFGGGLSLADAIQKQGLAAWIGGALAGGGTPPLLVVMGLATLLLIFLTELTSNTATAAAFLPVLGSLAVSLGENPLFLTITGTIAVSCAFMLPVATPPNAIVYGSGFIRGEQMARAGFVLNLLFTAVLPLLVFALVWLAFGARPGVMPPWAGP